MKLKIHSWILIFGLLALMPPHVTAEERALIVTATAYNSVPEQTDSHPNLAAWGDSLAPGMKAIAVSRDLIELGLGHEALVTIVGLSGQYQVLDKMHSRWEKRIDIYMGDDLQAARTWGLRQVQIRW